jgi:LacI family transcriptional regulator
MAPGSVTLRDVAEAAGVHPSTASRALNAETRAMVNPDTVKRVLAAAKRLGYLPNSLARGLKLNRTFTIGMLIPDLTNPLFPPIVRGVEDRMMEAGYTLILANTDNDPDKEASLFSGMWWRRVDGLILATARRDYPLLDDLRARGLPVVLINRTVDDPPVSAVTGDDHAGIGLAVRHLVGLGHRRIAHVAGTQAVSTGLARYQSFVSWMQSEGLVADPELIVFTEWFQEEPGRAACRELLDRDVDFSAVVAANDLIAMGCYDVLHERGRDVPADVSVVGYNDIAMCDKLDPPLTTVRLPNYQMGVKSAELLLRAIEEPDDTPVTLRLAPTLVERSSTAAPRPVATRPS